MYQNFPKNTEPQYQSQTVYGQAQPAQYQPAQYQPAQYQPAQYQPAQYQPAQYQPAQYGATVVYGTQPVYAAQPGQQVIITASPVMRNGYQGPQPAIGTFSDESDSGGGRPKCIMHCISLSLMVSIFLGTVIYFIYSHNKPYSKPTF